MPTHLSHSKARAASPRNITDDRGIYYRVRIERRGLKYTVNIPIGRDPAAALARAIRERDAFYAAHGETSPRSNTAIAGISELVNWVKSVPYPCFSVTVGASRRNHPVRFYYSGSAPAPGANECASHEQSRSTAPSRETALRAAIAHRTRQTGEDPAKLLAQAQEVCCA